MTDVQFLDSGEGRDRADIVVVQRMAGVEAHPGGSDGVPGVGDLLECRSEPLPSEVTASLGECPGIGACVHLADIEPKVSGGTDLRKIGVDERADEQSLRP